MGSDPKALGVLFAKQVIKATELAMQRATCVAHADLTRGLNTLATITSIAPFVGILVSVWAIGFDTFRGFDGPKCNGLAMVAEGISRACVPTALGLLVGLQSLWGYSYFRGRLEQFDLDMNTETLKLLSELTLRLSPSRPIGRIDPFNPSVPYLER